MTRRLRFDQLVIALILSIAFFFRVWKLGLKPPHFDEGINGHFVDQMWQDGYYRYDPKNFHGPLYFFVLQFSELIFGPTLIGYRLVTGILSVAATYVVAAQRKFFGQAAIWAALLIALSPAFVFYSRYAIHETLFILLQVIFAYGFFEFLQADVETRRAALTKMACGFFGMLMVKETLLIFFIVWIVAYFCARLSPRFLKGRGYGLADFRNPLEFTANEVSFWPDAIGIFSVGAFITIAVFSGFFLNPRGLVDMFTAFAVWTKTGTGATGHEKPFAYWTTTLLLNYEWPILAGVFLAPLAFFAKRARIRLMAFFAFGTWLAYSLVPYKTPWLILNMLWPAAIVVGDFLQFCKEGLKTSKQGIKFKLTAVLMICFAIALGRSTLTMMRINFVDFVNPAEPYVYVQTTGQYQTVIDVIEKNLSVHPEYLAMHVAALNRDPWPLPFTLEKFANLQWGKVDGAQLAGIDVVLIDASSRIDLEKKLSGKFLVMPFKIRDAYEDGFAYLNFDKFSGVVPIGTSVFDKAQVKP